MGRTAGFWEQDSAFPDGQIFISATDAAVTSGAGVPTKSALGLIGLSLAAAQTVVLDFSLNDIIFRYGKQDDEQQAFGSANPTNGTQGQNSLATPPGTFATNLGQSGRPPFTIAQNLVVPTSRPKGVALLGVTPVYKISTLAADSVALGVTTTQFTNVAAPVVTNVLVNGVYGLLRAVNANPYAVKVPIPPASQNMITGRFVQTNAEFTIVLPATSTAFFYGIFLDVAFNHN